MAGLSCNHVRRCKICRLYDSRQAEEVIAFTEALTDDPHWYRSMERLAGFFYDAPGRRRASPKAGP